MLRYIPTPDAGWLAFVHADLALVVRRDDVLDLDEYFRAVATGDIRFVLDALTAVGISAAPEFALVKLSNSVAHVIVRGASAIVVTLADGSTVDIDGSNVSTWTERSVVAAASFAVTVAESSDGTQASDAAFPITSGVVGITRLYSDGAEPPAVEPVVVPKPVAAQREEIEKANVEETIAGSADRTTAYAHLFEETIVRSVADAAVLPHEEHEEEEPEPEPEPVQLGDHDGETVMVDSVAKLLASRKREKPAAPPSAPAAPSLYLQLSNGSREPLAQPIILGRAPSLSKVSGSNMPRLVTIAGDDDLSRNHVQFAIEGGTVVVTDLHSRNGTSIVLPGKSPQNLRKGEPTAILVGTVVDLGGGTTITVGQD